jgi:hypothetical protein
MIKGRKLNSVALFLFQLIREVSGFAGACRVNDY